MTKTIIKFKSNIIYCIGLLTCLAFYIYVYSGVKEGYFEIFLLACIIGPMIVILVPKNNFSVDFIFAVLFVLVILLYAMIFWEYQDRPPIQITDTSRVSEESRGGWFSFENPLRINLLLICSTISILISSLIRLITTKYRTFKA